MEMMYARVGQALQAVGDSTSHPTDYLLFLCPGKNKLITGLLLTSKLIAGCPKNLIWAVFYTCTN